MGRGMYFVLPDVAHAQRLYKELLLARLDDRSVHVMAKPGTSLGDLPEASVLQKSDATRAAWLGLIAGASVGALVGVVVLLVPPSGLPLGASVVIALALLGAIMGVWISGMIGSSTPSARLDTFRDEVEHGKVLMLVDVPAERADEISHMIKQHHPEADMRSIDRTLAHVAR